ncbi:hypothetical protein G6553_08475 [Nocardioides sp. IC4_145]|uniref:hypothetical protein n=1 Tax=Nocardioides sp. IC4_145 TaxID=2714037 RepID=UPI00140ADD67|nr:hypothetical protein [Nocardioides sp. IC4_145]NHC23205.1 hypothetical protein [Nocardioides sp. IC4_145]
MFVRRSPAIVLGLVLGAAALAPAPAVASDGGTAKDVVSAAAPSGDGAIPAPGPDGLPAKRLKDTQESAWATCQGGSRVKLRTTFMTNAEIEVVGVVFSNDDDIWSWKFKHNGDFSFMGEVKAKDADRSFRIVRSMLDLSGPDDVLFRAQNEKTGETCKVEATV